MTNFSSMANDPIRLQKEIDKREKYIKKYDRGNAPTGFGSSQYKKFKSDVKELRTLQAKFVYPDKENVQVTGSDSSSMTVSYSEPSNNLSNATPTSKEGEYMTPQGGMSIAPILVSQQKQVSNAGNTFINSQGQGFSQNPDTVVKSFSQKPFSNTITTQYYSGRKEDKPAQGYDVVYGAVKASEDLNKKPKSLLYRGYENMEIYNQQILAKARASDAKKGLATPKEAGQRLLYQGELAGIGVVKGVTTPMLFPKETFAGLKESVFHPIKAVKGIGAEFVFNPAGTVGQFYGVGKVIQVGVGAASLGRTVGIRVVTKDVAYTKYLDDTAAQGILKGESKFPTSDSVSSALKDFSQGTTDSGTVKVISASPAPISSVGQARSIVIGGGTGVARTEGLYAAAYGKGSPYFFGIGKQEGYSYSILPKISSRPTLSVIEVSKIERIPTNVLRQGVEFENLYLQNKGLSGSGNAFITGNLERSFNKKLSGWSTTETEVVIPKGSIITQSNGGLFGFRESFAFKGRRIPVREYKVVAEDLGKSEKINIKNPFVNEGTLALEDGTLKYYAPKENISALGSYARLGFSRSSMPPSSVKSSSLSKGYSSSSFSYPKSSFSSSSLATSKLSSVSSRVSSKSSLSSLRSLSSSKSSLSSLRSLSSSSSSSSSRKSSTAFPPSVLPDVKPSRKNSGSLSFKSKPLKSRAKYGYAPSIEAELFDIKSSKVNVGLAKSGLVLRPIRR